MVTTFPTTSSYFVELEHHAYEIDQLVKAVEGAIKNKEKYAAPKVSSSRPSHLHLHTCTIESSLFPPEPTLQYYGRAEQPNPAYDFFTTVREKIAATTDPFSPLTLAPPSPDVVRPGYQYHRYFGPTGKPTLSGTKVYLPGAHKKNHLASLEPLTSNARHEWHAASKAWDLEHWIQTVLALDPAVDGNRKAIYRDDKKRFDLSSGLQICWVPDGEGPGAGIELKLLITIDVFVNMEAIFTSLPDIGNDLVGFVLHSLIPSQTTTTQGVSESETRAAALRHFYSCLRPAPDLPFNYSARQLQPKEMISKLLPFQTRTLRLLLQREQAQALDQDKKPIRSDPDGFWKGYDLGEEFGRVGYRRLTGDLVPFAQRHQPVKVDRKGKGRAHSQTPELEMDNLIDEERELLSTMLDLSGVRGTMLCEEMGLGKTVEAIALVLLHRHPLSKPRPFSTQEAETPNHGSSSRAPKEVVPVIDLLKGAPGLEDDAVHKWVIEENTAFEGRQAWDENAKLDVTEVATTLIVTPPSLLKQWVSEMQRHAPSLRICVYEGWKSLQKGVEKQRAARLKAQGAKNDAAKKRKNAQFRNQTRKKYAKSNGGARVKQESDEEDGEEDVAVVVDVEEEGTLQITQKQFVEYVRAHDVVVTTYGDLSQDLKVAVPVPPRSRRATANYQLNERPRSPLVMVEWWRVVMDEVQLHGDQTDAANMVSLIPRKNSLAVSGTPARADVKDLLGSLKFLRVPILPHDNRLWHRLQQPSFRPAFEGLFKSIAVRTTKKEVAGEFNLPHQSRFVVPIELSAIELHYYNDTLERTKERLQLPADPREARPADWVLDRALFRSCLQALRQICTHIQVGQAQAAGGRGDQRLHLGRALMTMTEALNKMITDHTSEYLIETRLQLRKMVRKAQLTMLDETNDVRHLTAINLYEKVRATILKQLVPVREHLAQLLGGREDSVEPAGETSPEKPQTQQERDRHAALTATRQTIREMSIILHQAWFFEGDVRHVQKEVDAEVNCYAQADIVRKEILLKPLQNANKSVELLEHSMTRTAAIHDVMELQTEETDNHGGLLSNDIAAQANDLLEILNDNAVLVFEWRAKILALLSSPIDASAAEPRAPDEGTDVQDPEAEYYAEALKAQGEVEAYLIAYASAIADRKEFMLESRSLLATHDARVTKQRSTKAAINAVADDTAPPPDVTDEVGEQAAVLMKERQAFRDARQEKGCDRPLKGLLMDLNGIVHGPNRPEEIAIAWRMAKLLKDYIHKQSEYVEKLNKELDLLRATFNRRVVYFAALQEISDSVSAPEFKDLQKETQTVSQEINEIEAKLSKLVIKGRYLKYLGEKQDNELDVREDCIICFGSSDDNQAVLLQCGHYFCLSCYKEFRKSPGGRKCPSCRIEIDSKEITRIKLSSASRIVDAEGDERGDVSAQVEGEGMPEDSGEDQESIRRVADLDKLKMMDVDRRREVMLMDMLGEYGSKINFLIKHLLYYKSREPETRHVIFSNWSDSLNIVMQALRLNGIKFSSFEQGKKQKDVVDQFINDKSISVFLLHAERESSGLTLTTCQVVHLLEPVLRHSFELQAIGRVDRLGQDKETTVYCYATMETVEARILSQGVRNGTSIYLDADNADHVVADMPNVVSAAHKGGDVSGDSNEEDLLGLIL